MAIPLDANRWVLSQVLLPGTAFYLGVAREIFDALPGAAEIEGHPLSLFSWTNDAEIYRGGWRLLGDHSVQEALKPDWGYRVAIDGVMMVENLSGQLLREYDPATDEHLSHRKIRSPLLFQDIVRSEFGKV